MDEGGWLPPASAPQPCRSDAPPAVWSSARLSLPLPLHSPCPGRRGTLACLPRALPHIPLVLQGALKCGALVVFSTGR